MIAWNFTPPDPIPLRRAPYIRPGAPKLAFMPGKHPAYQGENDERYPNTDPLAMADQDNTTWAGAYRGFVQYPREISANNKPIAVAASSDSVTEYVWGMGNNGGVFGRQPLSSRQANGNFFASDPAQFQSVGGGFCCGMSGGGGVTLDGAVPAGGFSFLTQGTDVVRPVYRQNYYGPVNPTMTTKDLQTASVYNPLPAFGTVVPKLP